MTKRRGLYRIIFVGSALALAAATLTSRRVPESQGAQGYYLPSTSQTVYRGFFPRNAPPALSVPSGAVVTIDTLSHQGLNSYKNCTPAPGDLSASTCVLSGQADPITFQAQQGVPAKEVLPDATDVFYNLDYSTHTKNGGGH